MTTVAGKDAPPKYAPQKGAPPKYAPQNDAPQKEAPQKDAQEPAEDPQHKARRAEVNSGNPRITVAFPFSRIDIREPSEPLRDLASLVEQLAEQVAAIAAQVASDQADASDRLAAQAALLARRLRDAP